MRATDDLAAFSARIPAELRAKDAWVNWKYVARNGKPTKLPINPRALQAASSTDPATWASFEEALKTWRAHPELEGVGFVFVEGDRFVGIDLDECIDADGVIAPTAAEIIKTLDSYAEVSPSGRGVKVFVRGHKPEGAGSCSTDVVGFKKIEVYSSARYFTVTGDRLSGASLAVEERQDALTNLCERYLPPKPKPPRVVASGRLGVQRDDGKLIATAMAAANGDKFGRLWAGDTSLHAGDESAADLALCAQLAFWTGGDLIRMDALFRRSGLMRPKWDEQRGERTYGQRTVERAIEGCNQVYSAGTRPAAGSAGEPVQLQVPKIVLSTDEHRVVDEAVASLDADPELFQRGNCLVRVAREGAIAGGIRRSAASRWIEPLPVATLRERLTRFASIVRIVPRMGAEVEIPSHPPGWLVSAVAARGRWPGVRELIGLSDVPVLRPQGTLFQEAGFDATTGVLLEPSAEFPVIPDGLTIDDADAALASLLDVIGDFRFERPEHKSAFIAALLTPLARFAFDGPAPLFLFDANVRGAGKGLLVQVIGRIALGHEVPVSSYSHDAEEMRKKITAVAIAGDRIVNLDNLEGRLGNDALDRALTTTRWRDRILGKSEQVELPLMAVWFASGNNVAVAADTGRRVIHIRLDVLEENPENRGNFKRPQLLAWVQENRHRLLIDAITILVAYCNAGRPSQGLPPFGSFEGWSRLVREAVVWAGLPDPCLTRGSLAESSDSTRDILDQLVAAWRAYDPNDDGVIVPALLGKLYDRQHEPTDGASAAMRAALENLVGAAPGRAPDARRVGNRLKAYRRRVVGGYYFDSDPAEKTRMGAVWRLKAKAEGGAL